MHNKTYAAMWAALNLAAPVAPALAANYQYTVISVPGALATAARGLNDTGTVVGDYRVPDGGGYGTTHCFIYNAGLITTNDPPGATYCESFGVSSDGTVVGEYALNGKSRIFGFIYKDGVFTSYGGAGSETYFYAISANGIAIGSTTNDVTSLSHIVEIEGGVEINAGTGTYAQQAFHAVNVNGIAVGDYYATATGASTQGLIYRNGRLSSAGVSGGQSVVLNGINAANVSVGSYTEISTRTQMGFVKRGEILTPVTDPNRATSEATGINDAGTIVGDSGYSPEIASEAFVMQAGVLTVLQPPGTTPYGVGAGPINNRGQVLLEYLNEAGVEISFIASPF